MTLDNLFLWLFCFMPIILFQIVYMNTQMNYFGWAVIIFPMMLLFAILFHPEREM